MKTRSKQEFLNEIEEVIANPLVIESGLLPDQAVLLKSLPRSNQGDLVDQKFVEWRTELLVRMRANREIACFEAIQTLKSDGVNFAYVIRRAFEFVYADLDLDSDLESANSFHQQRKKTSKAIAKFQKAAGHLSSCIDSEHVESGATQTTSPRDLKGKKLDLAALIDGSTGALKEIHGYEFSNSSVRTLRMVYGIVRSIRLNCVLPMNETGDGRWWKEVATIMTTVAQIIIDKELLPTSAKARVYDAEALRVMANDLKEQQIKTLINALKSKMPDFFMKGANGELPEALEELLERAHFHPSQSSRAIIELAREVRPENKDGQR